MRLRASVPGLRNAVCELSVDSHERPDADVTVVVPDEPPVLTPLAAAALLRLIRDVQRRRASACSQTSSAELSSADEPRRERTRDQ